MYNAVCFYTVLSLSLSLSLSLEHISKFFHNFHTKAKIGIFFLMLFQIIKYAGFFATSNRPKDDPWREKRHQCVELILFLHQKYCSVFQNNIFRQIVDVKISRSHHHNLTVVALIGTLLLKASHSRSY